MFHRIHRVGSVRFRCRAIAGAGGNDAASLGFGRQTKHPRGRQSPFPAAQHCRAPVSRPRWVVCRSGQLRAIRRSSCGGRFASARPHRASTPLYKRVAPPNLF
ncbi:hypothetical protein D5R55_17420 [Burkholderia cenocepacia]|uniref:Uncharacterized protein n=1 Tax=Burkholderia cenocepacia TaxID=95486 RepID=A0A3Q9FA48_9BURK|nr:hypothetical protein D5R55_17420 [Burkholderia cenocepacia]